MICIRCHSKAALSDHRRDELSTDVGGEMPANVCYRCLLDDPACRPLIMAWTYRKREETIQRFRRIRHAVARPLAIIDEWVDSLRR